MSNLRREENVGSVESEIENLCEFFREDMGDFGMDLCNGDLDIDDDVVLVENEVQVETSGAGAAAAPTETMVVTEETREVLTATEVTAVRGEVAVLGGNGRKRPAAVSIKALVGQGRGGVLKKIKQAMGPAVIEKFSEVRRTIRGDLLIEFEEDVSEAEANNIGGDMRLILGEEALVRVLGVAKARFEVLGLNEDVTKDEILATLINLLGAGSDGIVVDELEAWERGQMRAVISVTEAIAKKVVEKKRIRVG